MSKTHDIAPVGAASLRGELLLERLDARELDLIDIERLDFARAQRAQAQGRCSSTSAHRPRRR